MNIPEFPLEDAKKAYTHISLHPGNAAIMEKGMYESRIANFIADMLPYVPQKKDKIEECAMKLAERYLVERKTVLRVRGNSFSWHISGRAKFNEKRAERQNNAIENAEKRFHDIITKIENEYAYFLGVTDIKMRILEEQEKNEKELKEVTKKREKEKKTAQNKWPIVNDPEFGEPIESSLWNKTHRDYKSVLIDNEKQYRYRSMIIDAKITPVFLIDKKVVKIPK